MVVEDDKDIRKHLIDALELEDYEVISAENGKKALALLDSLQDSELPGCLILDLMMPEMTGLEFLEALNHHERKAYLEIKVLVATAKGSSDQQNNLPYTVERIQKPMNLDELYERLKKHC